MMRLVVLILALLAGAKVWTQEQLFRSAAEDAIVTAYKLKAIETCRKADAQTASATAPTHHASDLFAAPARIRLEVGNPDVDVRIWDVEHAAWPMRYKYPFLVLEAGRAGAMSRCAYDIKLDRARITQL